MPQPDPVPLLFQKERVIQDHPELQRTPEQMPDQLMAANLGQPLHAKRLPVIKVHRIG